MNILFLTIGKIDSFDTSGSIYTDLVRKFRDENHNVFVVHPLEKRLQKQTVFEEKDNVYFLRVKTGNITKTSFIEKGISTLRLEKQFISSIKKYLSDVQFDLVLYSTPPITFNNVIKYIKLRDNAISYLLLKDIFPQNAIDLKMFSKNLMIYKYFRFKEKQLYLNSDVIGCMSEENKNYIIKNNKNIEDKVEINPNSIRIEEYNQMDNIEIESLKRQLNIPMDKLIYLYGGNLGKPQGIDFLIDVIKKNENNSKHFILIVGTGTEYTKLDNYLKVNKINNTKLIDFIPKKDFDKIVKLADVGLIFLDYRFTIPNFPSRLLTYLQNKLPVLAATDQVTDIRDTIKKGNFGYWVSSNDSEKFIQTMNKFDIPEVREKLGDNGYRYLKENYDVEVTYNAIMRHF
ncbi:glycosyltransferase family 4 protein [Globicatella sanguinis]|uniref:glycosyltransferase family 4 protein n=1 Tax=Globicatella sanguinis TaxID=13076 RepID=UPI002543D80D|nr:glycosyltransferase family 4 protein [Globicatella sanguinis]MDK7631224.1 glycosyltransferase family 4 protein [Globicatella sanguinis]WIK66128.1 glycosyltransferase family 4 protein [Globicatella sanguinis]WKT55533.1 glycosyltransferase family 4 protein [Globicatella sanguinis]